VSGALDVYIEWASQLEKALRSTVVGAIKLDAGSLRGVAFLGMGGSGIVGDILSKHVEGMLGLPVATVKSFSLPRYVGRGWLAVAISYSGNTLETLTAFQEAVKRGVAVAAVASGGDLISMSRKLGLPYVKVDEGYLPRTALPALLAGTSRLLEELLSIPLGIEECVSALRDRGALDVAEKLARFLLGGMPVFVVPDRIYPLGLRAKNEFNENAKVVSKVEVLPELGHNDIVGWEGSPREWIKFVVLKDRYDQLLDFITSYIGELSYPVMTVDVGRLSYLQTVLYGSWVVGMASVILAKLRGVDPRETASIGRYKEAAKRFLESQGT